MCSIIQQRSLHRTDCQTVSFVLHLTRAASLEQAAVAKVAPEGRLLAVIPLSLCPSTPVVVQRECLLFRFGYHQSLHLPVATAAVTVTDSRLPSCGIAYSSVVLYHTQTNRVFGRLLIKIQPVSQVTLKVTMCSITHSSVALYTSTQVSIYLYWLQLHTLAS
jgi:hypothetical protein